LSKIFLQSARLAEDRLHKKYNKKINFSWTNEQKEILEKLWKWHSMYKSTNCERAKFLWKYLKDKLRLSQKKEMANKEVNKMIDLERLKNLKRNLFWETVKNYKRKTQNKLINNNLDFKKFSSYYSQLFINDVNDSENHNLIKQEVKGKIDNLKDEVYDEVFELPDIEKAIKNLKKGKSTGFDYISAETVKDVKKL
jgi:hypothetical protein